MPLVAENALAVNRHVCEMINRAFDIGLIGTADAFWSAAPTPPTTIALLQTAIYTTSTNQPVGVHEAFAGFARGVVNALTAAKTYGVLIDANISTVNGTTAATRKATFQGFFSTNDSSLAGTEKQCQSFSGTAG